jgi:hypothetical protein
MKVGDLVRDISRFAEPHSDHLGIIVAKIDDYQALINDVFRVLWADGDMTDKVWDYDLTKVDA